MKKIAVGLALLLSASKMVTAQTSFGVEAGLNISDYSVQSASFVPIPITTVWVPGFNVGGVLQYMANEHLAIQPALHYALNGLVYSYALSGLTGGLLGDIKSSAYIHTLRLPLNVEYYFGEPGENRFFVGAGPFLGMNLGGKVTLSSPGGTTSFLGPGAIGAIDTSAKISVGNDSADFIKPLDFGLGINAGYKMENGLFFRASASKGLLNLAPDAAAGSITYKSMNFGISVGYFFCDRRSTKTKSKKD